TWQFTDIDREFIDRYLIGYLPDQIFDAHAHLFRHDHYPMATPPPSLASAPVVTGLTDFRDYSEWLHSEGWDKGGRNHGGRVKGGLYFGLAFLGDRIANNAFVAQEVHAAREEGFQAYGQMVIAPDTEADYLRQEVQRHGFVGLKPYHLMAQVTGPTFQAPIEAYLPEAHVQVAHELGLTVTLHMVRDRALADPINQATIRRYCERYPNMRLILAHAARGFNPWHTIEGIESLRGLTNVWCDTSAVTEAGAFEAIVDVLGHERLLYGTDFPVSHLRGRCVAIGDSFHWLYAEERDLAEKHVNLQPVLIGLESLRSLILAFQRLKLRDREVEAIFWGNAMALFG
ncbi:MAG: amidohydrolase family protein, partial [Caldilineaceae bacterium]|nr:amidohydrolase family protein [Caldilineaceae bacterium]